MVLEKCCQLRSAPLYLLYWYRVPAHYAGGYTAEQLLPNAPLIL